MKKVTLTFIVSNDVVDDVQNKSAFGNMVNVAMILDENCEGSDYNIQDY